MMFRRAFLVGFSFLLLHLGMLQMGPVGCSNCDLEIKTDSLPDAQVGAFYSFELNSHCGGDIWSLESGQLPPGISLIQDGVLRGTPTQAGTYNFVIKVVDFDHKGFDSAFKGLALRVASGSTPAPTASASPAATPSATATAGTS